MLQAKPTVYLGTDHAGFRLKEVVREHLIKAGYQVNDKGAVTEDSNDDYPDFVIPAVEGALGHGSPAVAIVFGGSGNGECIVANKVKGARAALAYNEATARLSREHNDANVLCLGGRTVTVDENLTLRLVDLWLSTPFSGDERHARRIGKITDYEKQA